MTPKEKAGELYEKFYKLYPNQDAQFIATECALIAVDEMLEEAYFTDGYYDRQDYWEEVKQELFNY